MLKFIFVLVTFVMSINCSVAQQLASTKCDYYSHYELRKYLSDVDSIYKILKRKQYSNIIIVGSRGFNAATLMFVVKERGKNKAFFYDLMEHKKRLHQGPKLDSWVKDIVNDSSFLYTANLILTMPAMISAISYRSIIRKGVSQNYVTLRYQETPGIVFRELWFISFRVLSKQ